MKVDLVMLLLVPAITIALLLNQGWALSLTWNLFVPQFFGLPQLSLLIAIALVALFTLFKMANYKKPDEYITNREKLAAIFVPFVAPWISYLIALIATSFYF